MTKQEALAEINETQDYYVNELLNKKAVKNQRKYCNNKVLEKYKRVKGLFNIYE